MKFRTFSIFLLLTTFAVPFVSKAQLTPEDAVLQLTQTVSIAVTPQNPEPNSPVDISIDSSATDLDRSQISWSVNGKVQKSGLGVKDISLQTGAAGTSLTVNININPSTGAPFTKTVVIQPSTVDLLWQGNTYTPPFYEGRSLWTNQGDVTVVAIPHIISGSKELNISNLIYRWTRNGTVLGDQSGAGKNSLVFSNSIFPAPQEIQVDVSVDGNGTVASKTIDLAPANPNVLVYENNPLYGPLFNTEVGNGVSLKEKEITFIAYPMFFSASNRNNSTISYSWSSNGSDTTQNTSEVTFRAPDTGGGTSNLSVHVEDSSKITQTSDKYFGVEFGSQSGL